MDFVTSNKHKGSGHGLISRIIREKDLFIGISGSEGSIRGGGYFNTQYFADPNEKVIGILMKQTRNTYEFTSQKFTHLVFGSVVE